MKHVKIFDTAKIIGLDKIRFGEYVIIDDLVMIYAKKRLTIGSFVHIASFSYLTTGGGEISMKDFCAVSSGVKIYTSSDDYVDFGFGNSTIDSSYRNLHNGPVVLEKFSIVGANSVILPGVTIGEGCSVGANSVVTRDLEPWGVYIGNRRVKERDRAGILNNVEQFSKAAIKDRIGTLFKNES